MARKKRLAWSAAATKEWAKILAYYEDRNGSSRYGKRITQNIARRLNWVQQGLLEGQKIADGVRMIRQDVIVVLYEEHETTIRVVRVFDARRDIEFGSTEVCSGTS
ncbi:MAG: type II toxin-antitoxin system RelE/ParE family toxin [Thermoguttaceae bacterium]